MSSDVYLFFLYPMKTQVVLKKNKKYINYEGYLKQLDKKSFDALKSIFSSFTFPDDIITTLITSLHTEFDIIFDPHSVTSVQMALDNDSSLPTVAVATASPEKFGNVISPLINGFTESKIDQKEQYLTLNTENTVIIEAIKAFI